MATTRSSRSSLTLMRLQRDARRGPAHDVRAPRVARRRRHICVRSRSAASTPRASSAGSSRSQPAPVAMSAPSRAVRGFYRELPRLLAPPHRRALRAVAVPGFQPLVLCIPDVDSHLPRPRRPLRPHRRLDRAPRPPRAQRAHPVPVPTASSRRSASGCPPSTTACWSRSRARPTPPRRAFLEALAGSRRHPRARGARRRLRRGRRLHRGDAWSQVIVVSPGLPQLSTERELLKAYYQEFYGPRLSATPTWCPG